ncbi:MAG: NifU N-terminal domain-containing protein [Nitrospinota bacterium]|nr:NifU N-terminal domain-containing protein [Nitrospinota bacterium]
MSVQITVDTTPNENALKFNINKKILDSGYKTFNSLEDAKDFPVAAKIFENSGVASVFVMAAGEAAFITVTKNPETQWSNLQEKISEAIKAVL